MLFTRLRLSLVLAPMALLLLGGCGGSGDSSSKPTSNVTSLGLVASVDYNGLPAPLANPTATSADAGGRTTVTLAASGRTVALTLPATLTAGTFDLAATGGATATYSEISRAGGGTWKTVAGTVTVTAAGTNKWNITLTNAQFEVDGSLQGNPATGEFTMTGTAYGVPYTISVGPGGGGSFTVTGNTSGINPTFTPNYFLKSVVSGLVAATAVRLEGQTTTNSLGVTVQDTASVQTISEFFVTSSVSVGSGSTAKTWSATGGQIEVVKTGAKHKFILKDVVYAADSDTGATGGFTLNGSFEK